MTLPDGDDEALREAIEADFVATRLTPSEAPVEVHREADASWIRIDLPVGFLNVVVEARFEPGEADRRIDEILAGYRGLGLPGFWWVGPGARPGDLAARLSARGLSDHGTSPGMARSLAGLPVEPVPEGLVIEPVVDAAGLRVYMATRDEAIGAGQGPADVLARLHAVSVSWTEARLGSEVVPNRWLGRLGGRPVATGRLSLAGGVAGVYSVTTLPEHRGRGIGRAMTLAVLHAARDAGFRVAVLQSSPIGLGVYRRLGFRELATYRIFGWEAGGAR